MTDTNPNPKSHKELGMIDLVFKDQAFHACPPSQEPKAFRSFVMPKVPGSTIDFLGQMAHRFYARHQRCMAALLLLDVQIQRWTWVIPSQRCATDSASWTILWKDFPCVSTLLRLGGSFQSRQFAEQEEAEDILPPFCGLHFVLRIPGKNPGVGCCVRLQDGVAAAPPASVIVDEYALALEAHSPRMRLL